MNILYLAHRIPYPPNKGDKIRSFRQLEHLARQHDVWCACFVDTPADEQYVEPLSAFCREVAAVRIDRTRAKLRGIAGLIRGKTITESFYTHPAMGDLLREWARSVSFDAVVAYSSSMARYALMVPAQRRVLDLCDVDSRKWLDYAALSRGPMRWVYATEGHRLADVERAWIDAFDAAILITKAEVEALDSRAPRGKIHVVGNGVTLPDLADRSPDCRSMEKLHAEGSSDDVGLRPDGNPIVGFVGALDYYPNIDGVAWFVRRCWPEVRAAHPQAVFKIIGRAPARSVRRLARVPGVEVVGPVENIAAEVRKLHVSVAPLRIARGLQNKVLEAMAGQKLVVLTPEAAEGIAARDGEHYLVARTANELAHSVIELLDDPVKYNRLGQAARRFVATNHCWEDELRKLELIIRGVLKVKTRQLLPRLSAAAPRNHHIVRAGL